MMALGWYLRRLRAMGPAEVLHRLAEKGRAIASRRRDEGWQHYPARPLHIVFAGLRDASKLAPPELRRAITAAAEETLRAAGHSYY